MKVLQHYFDFNDLSIGIFQAIILVQTKKGKQNMFNEVLHCSNVK